MSSPPRHLSTLSVNVLSHCGLVLESTLQTEARSWTARGTFLTALICAQIELVLPTGNSINPQVKEQANNVAVMQLVYNTVLISSLV